MSLPAWHSRGRSGEDPVNAADAESKALGIHPARGNELGDSFSGSFAVESSILGVDGINQTAAIYNFYLPFGKQTYSTGPLNTALVGFRNPVLGAAAPGFVIEGGQVVDFYGGLYGLSDIPFIDMYGYGESERNRFHAFDGSTLAFGSLSITSAVPEPEAYAMFMGGLALVGAVVRRRRRQAAK